MTKQRIGIAMGILLIIAASAHAETAFVAAGEIRWAKAVQVLKSDKANKEAQADVDASKKAAKEGKGAVSLDGRLIDAASIRQAEALMAKVNQIKNAGK